MHQANTDGNENNDINACLKTYKKTTYTGSSEQTRAQTPEKIRWAIGKATD